MRRNRLVLAAAVVIAVGLAGMNLVPNLDPVGPGSSPAAAPSTAATPGPTPTRGAEVDPRYWSYLPGRHHLSVDGIGFSIEIPVSGGWEPRGPQGHAMPPLDGDAQISINRSYHGPQGAEAMVYWTSPSGALYTDPCQKVFGASVDPSVAELAAIVAAAPGTDLVAGPSDVTIGGHPAKLVIVTVREDMGCNPGYFFSWDEYPGGALWTGTEVGDMIQVWIIEVNGGRLFIAAETHDDPQAWPAAGDAREVVESIEFD
jgi:hypothetical protein